MTANEKERLEQFSAVLLTELVDRTRKVLELLQPEGTPSSPLPFAMTSAFAEVYAEVVKVGIFPVVFSRRPVRAILGDVDWARDGREYLLTVLDDRSNSIFVAWDYAWDALWNERKAGAEHSQTAGQAEKKGFFGSLMAGLGMGANKPDQKAGKLERHEGPEPGETMAGLYSMFTELSEKRGFLPLLPDDVKVFKGLVRAKPGRILAGIKELRQYHTQEFELSGHDAAKPGVLSEALQKWQYNLPERIGEFLVLKTAVDFEHVDKAFVGKYIRQSARSQEEAERGMPYLSIYWKAMPNAPVAED